MRVRVLVLLSYILLAEFDRGAAIEIREYDTHLAVHISRRYDRAVDPAASGSYGIQRRFFVTTFRDRSRSRLKNLPGYYTG